MFGLQGIKYIKYEKERLRNFLRINRNMKILITVSLKLVDISKIDNDKIITYLDFLQSKNERGAETYLKEEK